MLKNLLSSLIYFVPAFMQSKCVCPECVCGHPWPAFPMGGILCTDIYPCWNRADLGL